MPERSKKTEDSSHGRKGREKEEKRRERKKRGAEEECDALWLESVGGL